MARCGGYIMPFKSLAQMRKFQELVQQGKVTQDKYKEWMSKTSVKKLPDKVSKQGSTKPKVVKETKVVK